MTLRRGASCPGCGEVPLGEGRVYVAAFNFDNLQLARLRP
jgi:hypothetical protein